MVSSIIEKGVPCILAAGNNGPDGLFAASGAADAKGAIAVASVDNTVSPTGFVTWGEHRTDAAAAGAAGGHSRLGIFMAAEWIWPTSPKIQFTPVI